MGAEVVVVFVAWMWSVCLAFCHDARLLTLAIREVLDPEATAEFVDMAAMTD